MIARLFLGRVGFVNKLDGLRVSEDVNDFGELDVVFFLDCRRFVFVPREFHVLYYTHTYARINKFSVVLVFPRS